jgi:TrmH family RNA methyltransferase
MRARPLRRVSSSRNPALALVRALEAKRVRRERRLVVLEGEDLIDAALGAGLRPQVLLVDPDRVAADDPRLAATADLDERYAVPADLLKRVSGLAAAPRMIGVFPQPGPYSFANVPMPPSLALWLAGVGDPGNVGTLIRTSAALGCDWVALAPGSADASNPKAVRAAMGATFTIPVLDGVRAEDLATRTGVRVVAAVTAGGRAPWDADLASPCVIALGAERSGLEGSLGPLEATGPLERVTIPQDPGAESLNVSAAGAILLAEARRQRATRTPKGGRHG